MLKNLAMKREKDPSRLLGSTYNSLEYSVIYIGYPHYRESKTIISGAMKPALTFFTLHCKVFQYLSIQIMFSLIIWQYISFSSQAPSSTRVN